VVAQYPNARVVRTEERRGYGAATNLGVAESRGRYVLWCNNDLLFQPGAVDHLRSFLDTAPRYAEASPKLLNADGSFQPSFSLLNISLLPLAVQRLGLSRVLTHWDLDRHWQGHENVEQDVAVSCGACVLIRRAAFDAVGGIDERFFLYAEEFDLSHRFWKAGWRVRYLPESRIVHLGSQTTVKAETDASTHRFMIQAWRSHFAYLRKHYGAAAELAHGGLFAATALPRWAAARVGALAARATGDLRRTAELEDRARLHAYGARMALGAQRHDAARLPVYPSTRVPR